MLNLRGEVMKRSAVVSNSFNNRDEESIQMSSAGVSKRAPTASRHETATGWSAFESSIVGNLGAPLSFGSLQSSAYLDSELPSPIEYAQKPMQKGLEAEIRASKPPPQQYVLRDFDRARGRYDSQ